MNALKAIVLGFIAGAIATVTVHEFVSWLFSNPSLWTGWDRTSWSEQPVEWAMLGMTVPAIVNAMFWGGIWGSIFGLILGAQPEGPMTFRGAAMGIVGPAIIGLFILVPLLKGAPPFFDGDASRIIPALIILACYGASTAWLYGAFRYGRLPGF
jgi:hypothetical protein